MSLKPDDIAWQTIALGGFVALGASMATFGKSVDLAGPIGGPLMVHELFRELERASGGIARTISRAGDDNTSGG
jgi:hypothetical protein